MSTPDPAIIAASLSAASRAFLSAASTRPKKWMAIRRHAKLSPGVRVHGLTGANRLVESVDGERYLARLTPLGLAVKAELQGTST